ncbi:hypothetical protein BKA93DRAFT_744071 [Sparassis latifolia]
MVASIGYDSTLHRVLEIPEIIELVFGFLDEESNRTNVCVCKRWSEIALDVLWREVSQLHRLLRLLSPFITEDSPYFYMAFAKPLSPDDWRRFTRYARRVRKLSFTNGKTVHVLGQAVFDEIARTRTTLNILPNLQSLEWRSTPANVRVSLMFMHEGVKEFRTHLYETPIYSIADFFKDIAERMPNLTCLDLCFCFPVREIESALCELVRSLPKLSKIVLPLYCHNSRVAEALSALQHLGTIQFEYLSEQGKGDLADVQHFAPMLERGAFPSLCDLSLSAHLADMNRFLKGTYAPTNLTSLYIHALSMVPPAVVTEFLKTMVENCKLLTHLYLDLHMAADLIDSATRSLPPSEMLSFNDLRPLLACPKLIAFELQWYLPLLITQEEIEELASKWPDLEVLELDCEPIPIPIATEPLTLRALIPFAKHCPKLRELGLFVSATSADLDAFSHETNSPFVQPFRQLKKLCFGLSSITEPGPVALFLSELCPLGCKVSAGLSWQDDLEQVENTAFSEELSQRGPEWYDRWLEVDRVLPLLTRLRMEERERRRVLECEVEDLRVRCRVLEERATLPMSVDSSCLVL